MSVMLTTALRTHKAPQWPTQRFPSNPYDAGLDGRVYMPFTEKDSLVGFLIRREIGTVLAGADSPARAEDQPLSAELQSAVRQQALSNLQEKIRAIGATGIIRLQYQMWESHVGAHERVIHCTATGTGVIVGPIEYRASNK